MEGDKKGWETRRRRIYIILYEQSVGYNLKICIVLITDVYIDAINRKEGVDRILSIELNLLANAISFLCVRSTNSYFLPKNLQRLRYLFKITKYQKQSSN